jgi:hypothetical protein
MDVFAYESVVRNPSLFSGQQEAGIVLAGVAIFARVPMSAQILKASPSSFPSITKALVSIQAKINSIQWKAWGL